MELDDEQLKELTLQEFWLTPPAHLYKYLSVSDGRLEFVESLIKSGRLYFASPSDFNDPFDCFPHVKVPTGELERRRVLKESREAARGGGDEKVADAVLKKMLKMPKGVVEQYMLQQMRAFIDHIGVSCFAENPSSTLMWSHYADHHRGICVRLKMSNWKRTTGLILTKVAYRQERPEVGIPGTGMFKTQALNALMTKAAAWTYEQEWRAFSLNGSRKTIDRGPELIDHIYLGAKASEAVEKTIREWVSQSGRRVPISRVRLAARSFDLIASDV